MPIRPEMKHRYPADWDLRSRFVRFQRAGGQCEWAYPDGVGPEAAVHRAKVLRGWFVDMPKYMPQLVKWDHGQRTVVIRNQHGWQRSGLLRGAR